MVTKRTRGDLIFDCFNYLLLTALTLITLYPFVHVVAGSISGPGTLIGHKGALLWPKGTPTLKAFALVFRNPNIITGYKNTLIVLLVATTLNIVMTSLGAYVLSRPQFAIRKVMMFLIVFTMYFSGGMVPNFLTISAYGMYNTAWAIILPTAVSTYNMIVMRTTFAAVPEALRESAYIDGANDFVILYRIYIPVSKATMAVIILFYVVSQWNSWFPAMIYLRDSKKWPLQMILREILINDAAGGISDDADAQYLQELIKYCTIIVATVPILCIYPFVQKYFMKGVMLGSVKG